MADKSAPPTILLISYHFHPANEIGGRRATALARFLASKGVRVVVVSTFGGAPIARGSEVFPGVIAVPVTQPRKVFIEALVSLKRKAVQHERAAGGAPPSAAVHGLTYQLPGHLRTAFFQAVYFVDEHKRWGFRATRAAILAVRQYTARLVISTSPPFTVLLTGRTVAGRLGIPHVVDLRDPWTDAIAVTGPMQRLELVALRALEKYALRSAAAVISTSASLAEALANRYSFVRSKIHVVRNGYEGEPRKTRSATGGKLSILFAGELYVGRDPFPLLNALERVLSRPEVNANHVTLTFMGNAAYYKGISLAAWANGKRSDRVLKIIPQVPQQQVTQAVEEATVLLNLCQDQPFSVPAKTYEHLASGREILLICENESETARLVRGITGVRHVDQRNEQALELALLDFYRRHVVEGCMRPPMQSEVANFSRATANTEFWSIVRSVAGLCDGSPSSDTHVCEPGRSNRL